MTYHEILDKILDAKDATVGGGSAAALSGAMAAGLLGMVARLSVGKDYGCPPEECTRSADELDTLAGELLRGSVADTEAYCLIKAAYGVPKDEKERRSAAIQAAGIQAADVPLANGIACRSVLALGRKLFGRSNPNAASDLEVGLALAQTGITGCLANVSVNLALIKDENLKHDYEQRIASLERKGEDAC